MVKVRKYGEKDRLLTIFTRERGKITALAKGSRSLCSKRSPHLDLLCHNEFILATGYAWDIVLDTFPIPGKRRDTPTLSHIAQLYYSGELLDLFLADKQANALIYDALVNFLNSLVRYPSHGNLYTQFLLRYQLAVLEASGFSPELHKCLVCQQPLSPTTVYFSPQKGGVICASCAGQVLDSVVMSLEALKVMRFLKKASDDEIALLLLRQKLLAEVQTQLNRHIEWVGERKMRTTSLFNELNKFS